MTTARPMTNLKKSLRKKVSRFPQSWTQRMPPPKARLEKLSGEAFDRAYMKDMVADHTKDVREFKNEAKNGKDPDVKNFAAQTAPTLEDHLKEAKNIAPKTMAQITH